jgi:hypothetical protein
MRFALAILAVLALAGCQTSSPSGGTMTVIAPESGGELDQPQLRWVKRGNVLYLELQQPE